MLKLSPFTKGVLSLIGGFTIHLFFGCLYLFGNIQVYLTSYLHKYDESVTINSTLVIGPLLSITQSMTALFGPFLLKYVNVRILMLIGCVIALGGILISSFVTNLYLFILFYAAFYGWGMGICYLIPLGKLAFNINYSLMLGTLSKTKRINERNNYFKGL